MCCHHISERIFWASPFVYVSAAVYVTWYYLAWPWVFRSAVFADFCFNRFLVPHTSSY